MEKDNTLKIKEEPYMTREERIMYAKIAIDEALKNNDQQTAQHYKILLDMYNIIDDEFKEDIINSMKRK